MVTEPPRLPFSDGRALLPHHHASDPDPEIPNSRSPDSRFGGETGREPPFPDSAGNGKRGPDWPQIGKSGMPLCASTAGAPLCEYSLQTLARSSSQGLRLDVALSRNESFKCIQPEASPHFLNCQDRPMEDRLPALSDPES